MQADNCNLDPANFPTVAVYHMDCRERGNCIAQSLGYSFRWDMSNCLDTPSVDSIPLRTYFIVLMRYHNESKEKDDQLRAYILTSISILAHTPRSWKFNTAIPIEAAIMFAIQNTAIFANVWRSTLTRPETVTYSLRFPRKQH